MRNGNGSAAVRTIFIENTANFARPGGSATTTAPWGRGFGTLPSGATYITGVACPGGGWGVRLRETR